MSALIDTLDATVQKAVRAVETIAPEAWRLLVEEQRLGALREIASDVAGIVFFALASTFGVRRLFSFAKSLDVKNSSSAIDAGIAKGIGYAIIILSAIVWTGACRDIFSEYLRYTHPEPFAARVLLNGGCTQ